MKNFLLIFTAITSVVFISSTQAGEGHSQNHSLNNQHKPDIEMKHDNHDMPHKKDSMFLMKKVIDGYNVSFHIMKAKPGKEMGGSHDFMIKVEKGGMTLSSIAMNTKVVHPNGTSESKNVMKMGDWFMAGYDLGHEGKHQMMILFKTKDGKKHKGGVYY